MRNLVSNLIGTKTFAHGVHPPDSKADTCRSPIHQFHFAPLLIVPLSQHIGEPALPLVKLGDKVKARVQATYYFGAPVTEATTGK